ncbi:MAG: diguanylate cyclase [Burkholderiales bacterium]|nr:diguanylate cyclase [Burkholderiales bacterium]
MLEHLLLYGILPVWLLAGFADARCRRALHIETPSGWRESAPHWLMLVELGVGVLAILLLEIDALVLMLFAIACLAYELTMMADLRYAHAHRDIPSVEQWVHGIQQAIPWMVLLALAVLHPGQALALFGLGGEPPRWTFRLRDPALPPVYLISFVSLAVLLVGLPFAREMGRAARASRHLRRAADRAG